MNTKERKNVGSMLATLECFKSQTLKNIGEELRRIANAPLETVSDDDRGCLLWAADAVDRGDLDDAIEAIQAIDNLDD